MLFYGASGHAKVVVESWVATGGQVTAIFDDNEAVHELLSHRVTGKYKSTEFKQTPIIISIGSNAIRKKLTPLIMHPLGNVVHPSATISKSVNLGLGTVVMAGAVVNAETKVGSHVIINTAATIDHDCQIEDYVHVAPGAVLCGGVIIGEGAMIGAGATVIPEKRIGKWAVIGAGAVVIDDIPDFAIAVGNPARVIGKNTVQA